MRNHLEQLYRTYPLPSNWKIVDEDFGVEKIGETKVQLCGLAAESRSQVAFGSAASLDSLGDSSGGCSGNVVSRAFFELLERISIYEAMWRDGSFRQIDCEGNLVGYVEKEVVFPIDPEPSRKKFSKSNGVAIHTGFPGACENARREVIERDRVLRSWDGELSVKSITPHVNVIDRIEALSGLCRFSFFEIDSESADTKIVVCYGQTGKSHPNTIGYGVHEQVDQAIQKASDEAIQRLVFLWGEEEFYDEKLNFSPTPEYQSNYCLSPRGDQNIRTWLGLEATRKKGKSFKETGSSLPTAEEWVYVDLTPSFLEGRASVVRAVSSRCRSLEFGLNHPIV